MTPPPSKRQKAARRAGSASAAPAAQGSARQDAPAPAPAPARTAPASSPQDSAPQGGLVPHVSAQDAPRHRGRLDIAPTAIERLAEGAARRVPGVRPVSRRVGGDRLQVQARVLGQVASVHLQMAVGYPSPVRETCRQVRSAVVAEVRRLAEVEVTRLDVQVVELQHRPGGTRRVR